jgi:hypothetical protein
MARWPIAERSEIERPFSFAGSICLLFLSARQIATRRSCKILGQGGPEFSLLGTYSAEECESAPKRDPKAKLIYRIDITRERRTVLGSRMGADRDPTPNEFRQQYQCIWLLLTGVPFRRRFTSIAQEDRMRIECTPKRGARQSNFISHASWLVVAHALGRGHPGGSR